MAEHRDLESSVSLHTEDADVDVTGTDSTDPLFDLEGMDITNQIGRAMERFVPYFVNKLNTTLEGAVTNYIAQVVKDEVSTAVREEFDKRFPKENEVDGEGFIPNQVVKKGPTTREYDIKKFTVVNPPTYSGDRDPIVCTRWIDEIEGAFRVTQCPQELRTTMGSWMLRKNAKA